VVKIFSIIKTIKSLGFTNIISVVLYRLALKLGVHPVCHIKSETPVGPYFLSGQCSSTTLPPVESWCNSAELFSHFTLHLGDKIPNWLANPLTGKFVNLPFRPWWKISDFDQDTGDIKLIWEQSRMDWVVAFAQRARNGDHKTLEKLNSWLTDWISSNPAYLGPNWKCGQEASIRVINLACGALILNYEQQTLKGIEQLIVMHLRRIYPTINYAISQDNNHGTSEAAALFIGGSWLSYLGYKNATKWEEVGRKLLENRVEKLFDSDGGFSQYSINYHRMALDTLSFSEIWRRKLNLFSFSTNFYKKCSAATFWLYQLVSKENGRAPNIGANDGTRLLQLTSSSYKDYRPSVQLAMALFDDCQAYPPNSMLACHLSWLGVVSNKTCPPLYQNCNFSASGFAVLRNKDAVAILRYPRFKYRPSHADALHLDLWISGYNILNDAGSYSYNSTPDFSEYFSGPKGHNTVELDDRPQMPKISRFLFGDWLKAKNVQEISKSDDMVSFSAGYIDYKNGQHIRTINLTDNKVFIKDELRGFNRKAMLRWRLKKGNWFLKRFLDGVSISCGTHTLLVKSDVSLFNAQLSKGWYSTYYMEKVEVPVFEVEIKCEGSLFSEYSWK